MEVAPNPTPSPPELMNLSFDKKDPRSSPYITAPSSPLCSDPTQTTSPVFFRRLKPKTHSFSRKDDIEGEESDFEFDFSGHLDISHALSAADELFHGGKIKPLEGYNATTGLKIQTPEEERGRDRVEDEQGRRGRRDRFPVSPIRRGFIRSLSPLRLTKRVEISRIPLDGDPEPPMSESQSSSANSTSSVSSSMSASAAKEKTEKWSFRDFFLFRNASEGHAARKSLALRGKKGEMEEEGDLRTASFRSTESSVGSSRRRIGSSATVSAHELHYKMNRAAAEEMRRRTFLPYKQNLLGCLGFTSVAGAQEMSRGIGSLTR